MTPQKTISKDELLRIVSVPSDLHLGVVLHRLHKYYCTALGLRNKCTRNCNNCASDLCHIISGASDCNISDPIAFIVWACREAVAKIDEEYETSATPITNRLGEAVDVNPFALLQKQL